LTGAIEYVPYCSPVNRVLTKYNVLLSWLGRAYLSTLQDRVNVPMIQFIISGILIFSLSVATYNRCGLWQNDLTLWNDAAIKSPHKWRPCYELSHSYLTSGDTAHAIDHLQECVTQHPFVILSYTELGSAYHQIGDYANEIATYERALFKGIYDKTILNGLGDAFFKQLELEKALEQFQHTIALYPENSYAYYQIGLIYRAREDYRSALSYLEKARLHDPDNQYYNEQIEELHRVSALH
jgi:tetratricopeptide (TPR) repeat protein